MLEVSILRKMADWIVTQLRKHGMDVRAEQLIIHGRLAMSRPHQQLSRHLLHTSTVVIAISKHTCICVRRAAGRH